MKKLIGFERVLNNANFNQEDTGYFLDMLVSLFPEEADERAIYEGLHDVVVSPEGYYCEVYQMYAPDFSSLKTCYTLDDWDSVIQDMVRKGLSSISFQPYMENTATDSIADIDSERVARIYTDMLEVVKNAYSAK